MTTGVGSWGLLFPHLNVKPLRRLARIGGTKSTQPRGDLSIWNESQQSVKERGRPYLSRRVRYRYMSSFRSFFRADIRRSGLILG